MKKEWPEFFQRVGESEEAIRRAEVLLAIGVTVTLNKESDKRVLCSVVSLSLSLSLWPTVQGDHLLHIPIAARDHRWLHRIDTGLACSSPNPATRSLINGSMISTLLSCHRVDATELRPTHQVMTISINSLELPFLLCRF